MKRVRSRHASKKKQQQLAQGAGLLGAPMLDLLSLAPEGGVEPAAKKTRKEGGAKPAKDTETAADDGAAVEEEQAEAAEKAPAAGDKRVVDRVLPIGASLVVLLPPAVRPGKTEGRRPLIKEEHAARWQEAVVKKRSKKKPSDGGEFPHAAPEHAFRDAAAASATASSSNKRSYHLLGFKDGSAMWFDLTLWPFYVEPPAAPAASEVEEAGDHPNRPLMLLHSLAVEAAITGDSSSSDALPKARDEQARPILFKKQQQSAWLKQIIGANGPEGICQVVSDAGEQLDGVNVATALHRLARQAPFSHLDPFTAQAWENVRLCLQWALRDRLRNYSTQACANIAWALMVLEGQPKCQLTDDAPRAEEAGLMPSTVRPEASALLRLVLVRFRNDIFWAASEKWEKVAAWCEDWSKDGLWGGWKPAEVSSLCQACSRTRLVGRDAASRILCLLAQGVAIGRWRNFGTQEMATMTSSFQTADVLPPGLLTHTIRKATKNWDWFKPQEASMLLMATAYSVDDISFDTFDNAVQAAVEAANENELTTYNAIDLATFIWCVGKRFAAKRYFGIAYLESEDAFVEKTNAFTAVLGVRVMESLDISWKPLELNTVVQGMNEQQAANPAFVAAVCAHWRRWLGEGGEENPQAVEPAILHALVRGVARLGFADLELQIRALLSLGRAMDTKALRRKWRAKEACMMLWSAACTIALAMGMREENEPCLSSSCPSLLSASNPDDVWQLGALLGRQMLNVWEKKDDFGSWHHLKETSAMYGVHCILKALALVKGRCKGESTAAAEYEWEPPAEAVQAWSEAFAEGTGNVSRTTVEMLKGRSGIHKLVHKHLPGVLQGLFSEAPKVRNEVDVHGWYVDLVVTSPSDAWRPIAVEVDGPQHWVQVLDESGGTEQRLNGQSMMKRYILRHLGGMATISVNERLYNSDRSGAKLNKYLAKHIAAAAAPAKAPGKGKKRPSVEAAASEAVEAKPEEPVEAPPVRKKNKKQAADEPEAAEAELEEPEEAPPAKKKKKKQASDEPEAAEAEPEEPAEAPPVKKKKKQAANESEAAEAEPEEPAEAPPAKRKKKKHSADEPEVSEAEPEEPAEAPPAKKKKKKQAADES